MSDFELRTKINELRSRYRIGDAKASEECESLFGSALRRIIRRVIRFGRASSAFERRILSEADQLTQNGVVGDSLAAMVSRRVCNALLSSETASHGDTVQQYLLATIVR